MCSRFLPLLACLAFTACNPQQPEQSAGEQAMVGAEQAAEPEQAAPEPPQAAATECDRLAPEPAAAAVTSPTVGTVAGWEVRGEGLVCSEPGPEGNIGCELAPGGRAVAVRDEERQGYENKGGAAMSLTITASGLECSPLSIP